LRRRRRKRRRRKSRGFECLSGLGREERANRERNGELEGMGKA